MVKLTTANPGVLVSTLTEAPAGTWSLSPLLVIVNNAGLYATVIVSDVTVNQTYPFDTATFAGVVTQPVSKGHVGVNAGVNANYLLKRRASLTFGARYSHAHVPLRASASTTCRCRSGVHSRS